MDLFKSDKNHGFFPSPKIKSYAKKSADYMKSLTVTWNTYESQIKV